MEHEDVYSTIQRDKTGTRVNCSSVMAMSVVEDATLALVELHQGKVPARLG